MSLKVIESVTDSLGTYNFIVTMGLSRNVFEINDDFSKNTKFSTLFEASLRVLSFEFITGFQLKN